MKKEENEKQMFRYSVKSLFNTTSNKKNKMNRNFRKQCEKKMTKRFRFKQYTEYHVNDILTMFSLSARIFGHYFNLS